MARVSVAFLGSGDAFCSAGRHQAGYLLTSAGGTVLLDCGSTILASMKRDGFSPGAIDTVFISHLHGDHFAGLPFLFLEFVHVEPRTRTLEIAGPPGTADSVAALFRAMYPDAAAEPLPFPVEFVELVPGTARSTAGAELVPFQVPHQATGVSFGVNVTADGRRILYSGDTGWTEELVARSQGVDLFICECCFFETRVPFHLDYPRLLENRRRFGARRTVLTHLGREVLERRNEIEIDLARDGLNLEL